ncbi:L,D-transpeptidase [Leptolyngbya sp. GGD]|uniref:L,D-transpeptidase n=1 Tax=Leptolyngbya sp. GGD TaxID=2997907 RepID=UPI00227BE6CE|nr:L,D-transpeptidase [Leptolyngbya sp. GGD]MCY6488587.1 L,D-transpeptidase [Leptolyngbya sp. GGD]
MAAKIQESPLSKAFMMICVVPGIAIALFQVRRLPALPKFDLPNFQAMVAPKASPAPSPVIETNLVVDLSDRKVRLFEKKKLKATYPIAIGQEGWETPIGSFKVSQMVENPTWQHPITGEHIPAGDQDNPLGKRWIGFTSQGKLLIGFHGTKDYSLLGQAVSHGCLRMRNADVVALYQAVKVGTPVEVKK